MKKYVIIGNGTAAAGCIEGIRRVDTEGAITVVSAENHPVYCRPLISYYLEGKTDPARMKYRPDDFYDKNGCTVRYGRSAVQLNPQQKRVTLDNGETLDYDALCVAAGSSPFVPPVPGLDTVPQKFGFLTLDDAEALAAAVTPQSRVLIVGAGLIGLKCAEGLHGRVRHITVCDLADRVLSSILDEECAAFVQKHLEQNGISFLLGDTAAKFSGSTAEMKSGKTVEFDVLVMAVGVRANSGLVRDAGGSCGRGIVVDARSASSLPDVFAAGDCTETTDVSSGTVKVMALMPNAYMQGRCAGENMAGGSAKFDNAIPMNSIGFFGLHMMTAGSRVAPPEGEVYEEKTPAYIKKLFIKENRLIGFVLVGNTARTGIYTDMIRSRTPLDTVDFDHLKKTPDLLGFSADIRKKKLGSEV